MKYDFGVQASEDFAAFILIFLDTRCHMWKLSSPAGEAMEENQVALTDSPVVRYVSKVVQAQPATSWPTKICQQIGNATWAQLTPYGTDKGFSSWTQSKWLT